MRALSVVRDSDRLEGQKMAAVDQSSLVTEYVKSHEFELTGALNLISTARKNLEKQFEQKEIGISRLQEQDPLLQKVELALKICLGKASKEELENTSSPKIDTVEKFWGVVSGAEVALQKISRNEKLADSDRISSTLFTISYALDNKPAPSGDAKSHMSAAA